MARAACDTTPTTRAAELEHLLSLSRDFFAVVRLDGSLERVNAAFARALGYTEEQLVGRSFREFVHPDDLAGVNAAFADVAGGASQDGFEVRVLAADGQRWIEWVGTPDIERGVVYGLGRDLTARRRAEEERAQQAQALRESEQRFLGVVRNVPGAFFTVVPCEDEPGEMRIDFVSDNVAALIGHRAEEFVGPNRITIESLLVEDDRAVLRAAEAQSQRGEPYGVDVRLRHADGTLRWLHIKGHPLPHQDGMPYGSSGVMLDVSDRRRAELKLQESEALLRNVLANVPGVFFRTTPAADGWRVVYASDRTRELLGVEPETLGAGLTFESIVHPDDRARLADAERKLTAGEPYELDVRVVVDGRERWVREVAQPERDASGAVVAANGFLFDITERKHVDEAIRIRDRALETLATGVMIVDATAPGNPITYVNRAFEELTGYDAEELIGRSPEFLNGPETDVETRREIEHALAAGTPLECELLEYRKNGTSFWSAVRLSPVHDDDGTVTRFISLHSDETPRKRLENQVVQAQKMEAVGRLAGGIAHDFNNVLLVIRGYSHVLMSMLGEGRDGYGEAREIEAAAERASDLIRRLLAFSRPQVTRTELVDLNGVVEEARRLLAVMLGDDVELQTALDPRLPQVSGNAKQLQEALVSLATNAREAMPNGGTVRIRTHTVVVDDAPVHGGAPGTYAAISVEDTGVGMAEDTKARMFEPFFSTKDPKGSGLGLSTVYGLVKQSDGELRVASAPGEGTAVTICLPAATAPLAAPASLPASARTRVRETVLLVEDDERARALVGRVLREADYEVLEAAAPDEALQLCEAYGPIIDLLVSDVVMPQMSGPTLAKLIVERLPELPVLFVSGYIERADDVDVVSSGAGFLQKPFTPTELLGTVRRVLDQNTGVPA